MLQSNGYIAAGVRRTVRPRRSDEMFVGSAVFPCIRGLTGRIRRSLSRRGVRAILKPTRKIQQFETPVKVTLSSCWVYCVPCSCGQVYTGTKRNVRTRISEHSRSYSMGQSEKSPVARHDLANIQDRLHAETKILSSVSSYFARLYTQSVQPQKHAPIVVIWRGGGIGFNSV